MGKERIEEIDFLKCVLITLMVAFHLSYIGDKYADAKQVVYMFHMPAFLLISGFFGSTGAEKRDRKEQLRAFLRKVKRLLIPYLIMETAYACASALLPVRDGLESLTPAALAEALLLHPVGPYWYLHTLMLGSLALLLPRLVGWLRDGLRLPASAVLLALLAVAGVMDPSSAFYFFAGAAACRYGGSFLRTFRPRAYMLLPFLLVVICLPAQRERFSLAGVALTYFAVTGIMGCLPLVRGRFRRYSLFVGRNTLPVLLFSPLFTMAAKPLAILLETFDPTGICFLLAATTLAVGGSLLIAYALDRTGLSPYFFGQARGLAPMD